MRLSAARIVGALLVAAGPAHAAVDYCKLAQHTATSAQHECERAQGLAEFMKVQLPGAPNALQAEDTAKEACGQADTTREEADRTCHPIAVGPGLTGERTGEGRAP